AAAGARRTRHGHLAAVRLREISVPRALQRSVRSFFGAAREAVRPGGGFGAARISGTSRSAGGIALRVDRRRGQAGARERMCGIAGVVYGAGAPRGVSAVTAGGGGGVAGWPPAP